MLDFPSVAGATADQQAAYEAFAKAQRAHIDMSADPASKFDERLKAGMDVATKWKAFLYTCEAPKTVELENCEQRLADTVADRAELHEAAISAQAMLRGVLDIGGLDAATGEDANLCINLIHEAHDRLRRSLQKVKV